MCPLIGMVKSLVLNFEVYLVLVCGAKCRVLASVSEVSARKLSNEDLSIKTTLQGLSDQ